MAITEDLMDQFGRAKTIVTIGNFDGIHKGHQKIFAAVVTRARETDGSPVAVTFSPHPVKTLLPDRSLRLITSEHDKERLIFGAGIRDIVNIDFNEEFARTDSEDFIRDILVGLLKAKWVIVGHNCRFGRARKGNTDLLRSMGRKYGFRVSVIRYAKLHGDIISSSRVRSSIVGGRISETALMLGRAYHIDGRVVKGAGRGAALLGVPTANIETENELIPKEGVYAVRISLGDNVYGGVANIGRNPTFGRDVMSYEMHILDFRRNLLGKRLRVHFIERIRDEKKFGCPEALGSRINKDIETARSILAGNRTGLYL
jgi:riboflavin kinase / FMN adenylyltransferase